MKAPGTTTAAPGGGPAADARPDDRWQRLAHIEPSTLAWIALGVMLVVAAGALYHLTRGTTFWFDEWNWVTGRRGNDAGAFLDSYNGHFSLIPVAIYRLLFATAGLSHYGPYRVVLIAADLVSALLVFVYAKRRVGDLLGLIAAALVLFLGPGWQDILWPFQVAWLISLAAGVGALLMLDRRTRGGDILGCVCLGISLASSGVGVVVALGLVVDVTVGRRRWRDGWIVAIPLVLYAVWWIAYQVSTRSSALHLLPGFVANEVAVSAGSLTGLAGSTGFGGKGDLLTWGRPFALVALVLVGWRLFYLKRVPTRVLSLATMLGSFWVLTAWTRAWLSGTQAWASRYLYVDALLLVLLAAELAAGIAISRNVRVVIAVVLGLAVVGNVNALRQEAEVVRTSGEATRADLGALQIGRNLETPDYVAQYMPGYPLVRVGARDYFAAAKSLGSPAATPGEIVAEPNPARQVADSELIRIHQIALRSAAAGATLGARPVVKQSAGAVRLQGACVVLTRGSSAKSAFVEVIIPPAGVIMTAGGGPATVGIRRFADISHPLGTLADSAPAAVRIAPDRATQPWLLTITPTRRVAVCGLG